jgi:hypothetical protein
MTTLLHSIAAARTDAPGAVEAEYKGLPESVPATRQFVRDSLTGCPRLEDLVLAVSEFAANTVAWCVGGLVGETFTIRVRTAPRWARVELTESGPSLVPPGLSNDWGLDIVTAFTDRSGAILHPDGARTVFAEATWSTT